MFFWDNPQKVGNEVTDGDGTKYFRGPGYGTYVYLTQARALSRDFIKGGDAIFLLSMEGKKIRVYRAGKYPHVEASTLSLKTGKGNEPVV